MSFAAFLRFLKVGIKGKYTHVWRNCPCCGVYSEIIVFVEKNDKKEYVVTRILTHGRLLRHKNRAN